MSDSPPTKIEKTVDFGLCFICQTAIGPTDYTNFVLKPQLSSVEKLATCAEQQYTYGETKFASLNRRLQDSSAEELLVKGLRYHKVCYKDVTNKVHIDRAKARFEKGTTSGSVTEVRLKKRGRPASTDLDEGVSTPRRCVREQSFDKHRCIICQEDTVSELHNVSTKNMGLQLKNIGQNTSNDNLKVRLNSVISSPDLLQAMAEDMKYHLPCLVKAKRDIAKTEKQGESTKVNFRQVVSDLEILDIVETAFNDTTKTVVLNMNEIQETYVNLLKEHDLPVSDNHNYKPHLKQLILQNTADVHFSQPSNRTKPEQVLSTKLKDEAISSTITSDNLKDDLKVLLQAAKILRKDIASSPTWKFNGTFADYKPPPMLSIFCKYAVAGTRNIGDSSREDSTDVGASLLAQHFVSACKSDRQISYKSKSKDGAFKQRSETPLSVGLALDIHKNTRSKVLVETLAHLDLAISYQKVMEIETSMANSVLKQMESMGGICQPPWLVQDKFIWFALDNIDFLESTPCGMDTLHGTAMAIYQTVSLEKSPMLPPIDLDRSSKAQTLQDAVGCKMLTCRKPEPGRRKSECQLLTSKPETDKNKKIDLTWIIGCMNFGEEEIDITPQAPGTWGAFNSMLSSPSKKTNVALVPPLIRSPPTEYDTLYTGMMRARDITTRVMGNDAITVMTLIFSFMTWR